MGIYTSTTETPTPSGGGIATIIDLTTDASGNASWESTNRYTGTQICLTYYKDGSTPYDSGANLSIYGFLDDQSNSYEWKTILVKASFGGAGFTDVPVVRYPFVADTGALLTNSPQPVAINNMKLSITISNGTASKVGSFVIDVI